MDRRNIAVGLDVGTGYVKAALGEVHQNREITILGVAQVPSVGLRKGNIVDIEGTARSIDECLNQLERLTGVEILGAVMGYSSPGVNLVNNHALVTVGNSTYEIDLEDKERVLQSARNIALPPDRTIVQVIERQFIVDGYDGVKDPVGMIGSRLEAEVAIIVTATAAIQNLFRSTERINLQVGGCIYNPILTGEAVLLPTEKEMGVILVDIGAGKTEVSFFNSGTILYSSVLPVGGDYITKDLAIVLKTSIEEAARIKETYGVASPALVRDNLLVDVKNIQGRDPKQVSQQIIADIIFARVKEIVEMIDSELNSLISLHRCPGGIVLTGGGACLPGMADMVEDYFNLPVRIGIPENIRGIPADYNQPQNAAALGALIYSSTHIKMVTADKQGFSRFLDRISYFFHDLFS